MSECTRTPVGVIRREFLESTAEGMKISIDMTGYGTWICCDQIGWLPVSTRGMKSKRKQTGSECPSGRILLG